MTCGGDWVQMAIKFVSDAMGNAIGLRKQIDGGRLAQRPLDIRIFLPRIDMSTARPNVPGMPNMNQMNSFGMMVMSLGMQAQMNLAPGDMLGDVLRVLSDEMVHLYQASGVLGMKKVDMLDIDLGPAWEGCDCCGFAPPFDRSQGDSMLGMLSKMRSWRW